MTDFCEATIGFWRSHPQLRRHVDSGLLDFARFDPESGREVSLLVSGETLRPDTLANPLIAIANYFFDGIPQDAFGVLQGKLHEYQVAVPADAGSIDRDDPQFFAQLNLELDARPVSPDYYEDPEWNTVLRGYENRLDDTTVLFPVAALGCLENLMSLSGGRLLLISGDKGLDREETLLGLPKGMLAAHGSFSLPVNYDAMGRVFRARGGVFLKSRQAANHLAVTAFVGGRAGAALHEIDRVFEDSVGECGPDGFYVLKKAFERFIPKMSLEELLAALRFSGWDPDFFRLCASALSTHFTSGTQAQREELLWGIEEVCSNYFSIGEDGELAACIGDFFLDCGLAARALEYYGHAEGLGSVTAETCCRKANALYYLSRLEEAREQVELALEMEPGYGAARGLRIRIEEEQARLSPSLT